MSDMNSPEKLDSTENEVAQSLPVENVVEVQNDTHEIVEEKIESEATAGFNNDLELSDGDEVAEEAEEAEEDVVGEEEDDADLEDAPSPLVTPMRENKYKRGTFKWVGEQYEITTERLGLVEDEFSRLQKVLKLDTAILHSSRKLLADKESELDRFIEAKESLDSWISERHGTFAWQLLELVSKEKEEISKFEEEIRNWSEDTNEDLYQESHKIKKRFVRRFRWSILGIIFSLAIGWVIQQVLNYFGIGWISSILALLGLTNPFTLITKAIGYGSLFAWITNLFAYFRDYFIWKKKLAREIEEARYYIRAAKDLDVCKARVNFLSTELENYLRFLAEIIHKPWQVSDEWMNFEKSSIKPELIPTLLVVGKPNESGVYQKVTKRALEGFAARDWHALQFETLLRIYEDMNSMKEGAAFSRIDSDSKLRDQLISDISNTDLLQRIGSELVIELAKELQNDVLPSETGFYLNSVKPDALEGLDLSSSILGSEDHRVDWHSFVTSILGPSTDWSPIAFGIKGRLDGLQEIKNLQSFALLPDRLVSSTDSSVKPLVVNKSSNAGVEVVIRIDASGWIDPDKVQILDGLKIPKNVSSVEREMTKIDVDPKIIQG